MTAMDEIILSTPDKLLSGKAVMEVFSRCVPMIMDPYELLSKDVDFLMACLRLVSFGETMNVLFTHTCEDSKEHEYVIDLQKIVSGTKQIDPTILNTEYVTTVPNGQVVTMKPLTYGDVVEMYQTTVLIKSDELTALEAEKLIVSTMTSIIRSVDSISNVNMIREWVSQIPLGWKRQIERAVQDISQWGVDFVVKKPCMDCKEEISIQVTANPVSFFT
jgi:hypothetical protein